VCYNSCRSIENQNLSKSIALGDSLNVTDLPTPATSIFPYNDSSVSAEIFMFLLTLLGMPTVI